MADVVRGEVDGDIGDDLHDFCIVEAGSARGGERRIGDLTAVDHDSLGEAETRLLATSYRDGQRDYGAIVANGDRETC